MANEHGANRQTTRSNEPASMGEKGNNERSIRGSESSDNDRQVKEFKEGGYGWYVLECLSLGISWGSFGSNRYFTRVVVATVFLINMHTWGMNSVRLLDPDSMGEHTANNSDRHMYV